MENIRLTQYGKTSQEPFPATRERISKSCSKSLSKSQSQKRPRCLCLKKIGGGSGAPDVIMGNRWSIAYRVFDAKYWGVPQRRKRIHLVADFKDNAPEKYYLSAKACEGILRRAERRGKELPPILKEALKQQIKRAG